MEKLRHYDRVLMNGTACWVEGFRRDGMVLVRPASSALAKRHYVEPDALELDTSALGITELHGFKIGDVVTAHGDSMLTVVDFYNGDAIVESIDHSSWRALKKLDELRHVPESRYKRDADGRVREKSMFDVMADYQSKVVEEALKDQEALVNQMREALEVVARTPHIAAYLKAKDPAALRQVRKALKSGEPKKPKEE
jgi:hypothetical protein